MPDNSAAVYFDNVGESCRIMVYNLESTHWKVLARPVETSKQTRRRRNPALKEGEGMVEKWKLNTDQSLMFIHFTGESWRLQRKMVLQTWLNQSLSWKGIWKSCWCTLNTSDFRTFIVVVMKLRIAKFYFHATDIMLGWTCLLMKDVMIQMWVSYTYNMRSDMAVIKW